MLATLAMGTPGICTHVMLPARSNCAKFWAPICRVLLELTAEQSWRSSMSGCDWNASSCCMLPICCLADVPSVTGTG